MVVSNIELGSQAPIILRAKGYKNCPENEIVSINQFNFEIFSFKYLKNNLAH